ncbi:MAG: HNH endonuclease [Gemmatimonadetes bacterium]|nr:HNH endonuclease [Gemmatimonadota bacterium]
MGAPKPCRVLAAMSQPRPPSPSEQLEFLRSFQRLLDEGSFVATYKFALLHAIADLCVLQGDDSGAALELATFDIAEHFVRLYWPQVIPFMASEEEAVLRQNTGRQAQVVRAVREAHEHYDGSLASFRHDVAEWTHLVRSVQRTVEVMPLWKVQTVGSDRLEFLYSNQDHGHSVRLEPGVAYCLRAFYPMLVDMIEGAWSHFIQRHNPRLLKQVTDLRSFLFGSERAVLDAPRFLLRDVQEGRCFYCTRPIAARADVDHFIPWRRYPLDLGHNLVLAHPACNSKKSDLLAAEEHLERWVERNRTSGLEASFEGVGIRHSLTATLRVAAWAYGQVHKAGGQVWVAGTELRPLGVRWDEVLARR